MSIFKNFKFWEGSELQLKVIASARGGKLLLDGKVISAEQPFPDVLHAKTTPSSGQHKSALVWENIKQVVLSSYLTVPELSLRPSRNPG